MVNEHDRAANTVQDMLIGQALLILQQFGLLRVTPMADVFCAYCGDHIIFEPVQHNPDGTRVKASMSQEATDAVQAHRRGCVKFLNSLLLDEPKPEDSDDVA